jgi:CheY-like chemotaxis protein
MAEQPGTATDAGESGRRVLLVEDAPFVLEVMERVLTAAGYRCATAMDGAGALAAAAASRFDLIITDFDMPDLDGCELISRLRAGTGPNWTTPILLMSAYAGDDALAERAMAAGADAVLAKPIVIAEVLGTLAQLLPATPRG